LLNFLLTKLRTDNPIARDYQVLREVVREHDNVAEENVPQVRMVFLSAENAQGHPGRFNAPRGTEVAALIFGGEDIRYPDVAVYRRGRMQTIPYQNPHVDALLYSLLFPVGFHGWQRGLQRGMRGARWNVRQNISIAEFYCFIIAQR
jgi:hypothetical protein